MKIINLFLFLDEHHPLHDDDDFLVKKRLNSAIHVKVFRPYFLESETSKS